MLDSPKTFFKYRVIQMNPMKFFRVLLAGFLGCAIVAGAFVPSVQAQTDTPKPPINDPTLLPKAPVQAIKTLADVRACIDQGTSAFGVTMQTTNVRSAPSTDACRYGKLPKGTLVEITGYNAAKPVVKSEAATATGPTVGYVEDIQPLFVRSCAACHNAAAKIMGLQTTLFTTLMAGGQNGPVVVPGDPDASKLWQMISTNKMPATGPLPAAEQEIVRKWIAEGAAERRTAKPAASQNGAWLTIANAKLTAVNDACAKRPAGAQTLVSGDLIAPLSCGAPPSAVDLKKAAATAKPASDSSPATTPSNAAAGSTPPKAAAPATVRGAGAGQTGIQAAAFGLPDPAESDPYLSPQGFCIERRLPDNTRGITAMAFTPDGRLFLALDADLAHDIDPLIMNDAFHPSRSVAVYDYVNDMTPVEIMQESSRITGLDYQNGALYLSRAGEVGYIPDGGAYEPLAGGFAVASQLYHANDGIVIANGWVYVSAGGIRDGYVDGPIVGVGEAGAQDIVSGGNPFAARIVRAPLDALLSQRSIGTFSTAGRGVRNPYGITADPSGRIWFTDNGATNVPDAISAGDEVNLLDPATIGGDEGSTAYYGFPLALNGEAPDWYAKPVAALVNSAAPTGITWAYDTIFYGEYGRNPGLYRLGKAGDGSVINERIMMAWPVLALATAPDGALWVGMGDGGLYRMTPGCK